MKKHLLVVGIIFLFILSSVTPLVFGSNIDSTEYDIDPLSDYYSCYSLEEIPESIRPVISKDEGNQDIPETENVVEFEDSPEPFDGPMDSPWPMYCHDTHHTGQSPYNTANNPGLEKWRFDTIDSAYGSPAIDNDGTIYIGGTDLFAIFPDGTLKWIYDAGYAPILTGPAIDENGIIYFGNGYGNRFFAIYSNNGSEKWSYFTGHHIQSSPAIGNDGSVYFGCENQNIYALHPNGTLKWTYTTGDVVLSSPAIGDDGTIYCGSHDTYLYALYPNNGTLKWKYKTDHWIRTSPCIADDGTIYVVSLDNHLHAVNPDGSLKWKAYMAEGGTSPTIGNDGTIYAGYHRLRAYYPNNGTLKWIFDPGPNRLIRGGTPCHSADDIIYFGTHIGETDGGELIAVNPDGTERWRIMLATTWIESAPAIGNDGTIYVGSVNDRYQSGTWGNLHAVGELDPNAPSAPVIDGPTSGWPNIEYDFTFKSTSPLGNDVYYWIEWHESSGTGWIGPYSSGEEITVSHKWTSRNTYTIKARVKDTENLWSDWSYFEVTMPRDKIVNRPFQNFLQNHPNMFPILQRFLNI